VNMATAYQWSGPGQEKFSAAGKMQKSESARPQLLPRPALPASSRNKKPAMVEFYTVKRIDNSRLVRYVEPVKTRNLYKTVALGSVVAAFCMMYVYQHFRYIDMGLQLEDLKSKTQQAKVLNSQLKLDIASLRDPRRIDLIARGKLGLTQPTTNQIRDYANSDGSELAEVQNPGPSRAR
jgi:cell division protein FtsL